MGWGVFFVKFMRAMANIAIASLTAMFAEGFSLKSGSKWQT